MFLTILVQKIFYSFLPVEGRLPLIVYGFTFARVVREVCFQVVSEGFLKVDASSKVYQNSVFVVKGVHTCFFWDVLCSFSPREQFS